MMLFAHRIKRNLKVEEIPVQMMLSQMPALFARDGEGAYRDCYVGSLMKLGIPKKEAVKLFRFEGEVIRRWNKQYLTDPKFVKSWFFGLRQKFFTAYPSAKEDVLRERFFTVSELCKLIDEAEWHFWNSHERGLSPEVWQEICDWRLDGPGGEFAIRYFETISKETGVPMEHLAKYSNREGSQVNIFKWM